jgi:hypothetical protein
VHSTWRALLTIAFVGTSLAGCQPVPSTGPSAGVATPSAGTTTTPSPSGSSHSSAAGTTGTLTLVARLAGLRAAHTATTLHDGRVLIAGGCTRDSCEGITASTELLDPATGASSPGPSMLQPRVGQAAVLLPDGRVLMIGGFQPGTQTASTEIFDPATSSFAAGPDLLEALADPVAMLLQDGSVLVAGGFSNHTSIASAELLDPGRTSFRSTGPMSSPRSAHAGALLPDGRVIVIGGNTRGDTGTVLASAEVYDPATGTWASTDSMSTRRHKLAVVALADGRVLVLGGSNEQDAFGQYRSAEIYDPATGSFAPTGNMNAPRYKISGAVVRLDDGRVLVAGGSATAEVYDPTRGSFQLVDGDANTGFSFAEAAVLPDGTVLVSGGYDDGIHLTDQVLRFVP